jgi:toluene monooxygenase electron transfer component
MIAAEVGVTDSAGRRVSFLCREGERLLLAGLAEGVGLPHECASGTCGSCRAKVLEGSCASLWPEASGMRHLRGAPGEVLMCQTRLLGPLELSIRGRLPPPPAPRPAATPGVMRETARLTPEIATFRIDLPEPMPYEAGQFVLVELDGIPGPRAWSMTSHAPGRSALDLLVRRAQGGACSARLFGERASDLPVRVFGPLGRAVFRPEEGRPFTAVAGGSGIAGMLAILDRALATGALVAHPSQLFFGLRDRGSAYLLDRLAAAVRQAAGGLEVTVAFSDAPPDEATRLAHPELRFAAGLVHEVAAAALSAAPHDPAMLHFVAGPPPMVDAAMRALVIGLKVPPTEIRYDRFG